MALHEFVPGRANRRVWLSLLVAAVLLPAVVRSEYLLNTAVLAGIYIILTSSLNITNGYTGLFSFGHAAFYGIGAYTAAILATRLGAGFWLTLPMAGLVAALFGAALAVPTLRLSGIFLALVTIGFQEIAFLVTLNWIGLTRGPMGIPGVPPPGLFGFELPYMLIVYEAPRGADDWHLAVEFYPPHRSERLTKIRASVETSTLLFINDTLPEESAARLRAVPVAPFGEHPGFVVVPAEDGGR